MTARRPTLAAIAATAAPAVRAQLVGRRPTGAPDAGTPRTVPLDASAVHHRRSTPVADGVVVVEVPGLRLVNPLNQRQGWRAVSARGKREKAAVAFALRGHRAPPLPLLVTIVRVSPGRLDDDGATASAKHVRDTVATWAGVDDGSARIRFVVTQEKGAAGVRITAAPWVARRVACPSCGCSVAVEGTEAGR